MTVARGRNIPRSTHTSSLRGKGLAAPRCGARRRRVALSATNDTCPYSGSRSQRRRPCCSPSAQSRSRRSPPAPAPDGKLNLRRLLTRPAWLAGQVATVVAVLLQVTALGLAPVSVVQPLLAGGLVVALAIRSVRDRRLPSRTDLVGAALAAGGLAVFLIAARPADVSKDSVPGTVAILVAALVALGLIALTIRVRQGPRGALAAGLAAGVAMGIAAVLISAALTTLSRSGLGAALRSPAPLGCPRRRPRRRVRLPAGLLQGCIGLVIAGADGRRSAGRRPDRADPARRATRARARRGMGGRRGRRGDGSRAAGPVRGALTGPRERAGEHRDALSRAPPTSCPSSSQERLIHCAACLARMSGTRGRTHNRRAGRR